MADPIENATKLLGIGARGCVGCALAGAVGVFALAVVLALASSAWVGR